MDTKLQEESVIIVFLRKKNRTQLVLKYIITLYEAII